MVQGGNESRLRALAAPKHRSSVGGVKSFAQIQSQLFPKPSQTISASKQSDENISTKAVVTDYQSNNKRGGSNMYPRPKSQEKPISTTILSMSAAANGLGSSNLASDYEALLRTRQDPAVTSFGSSLASGVFNRHVPFTAAKFKLRDSSPTIGNQEGITIAQPANISTTYVHDSIERVGSKDSKDINHPSSFESNQHRNQSKVTASFVGRLGINDPKSTGVSSQLSAAFPSRLTGEGTALNRPAIRRVSFLNDFPDLSGGQASSSSSHYPHDGDTTGPGHRPPSSQGLAQMILRINSVEKSAHDSHGRNHKAVDNAGSTDQGGGVSGEVVAASSHNQASRGSDGVKSGTLPASLPAVSSVTISSLPATVTTSTTSSFNRQHIDPQQNTTTSTAINMNPVKGSSQTTANDAKAGPNTPLVNEAAPPPSPESPVTARTPDGGGGANSVNGTSAPRLLISEQRLKSLAQPKYKPRKPRRVAKVGAVSAAGLGKSPSTGLLNSVAGASGPAVADGSSGAGGLSTTGIVMAGGGTVGEERRGSITSVVLKPRPVSRKSAKRHRSPSTSAARGGGSNKGSSSRSSPGLSEAANVDGEEAMEITSSLSMNKSQTDANQSLVYQAVPASGRLLHSLSAGDIAAAFASLTDNSSDNHSVTSKQGSSSTSTSTPHGQQDKHSLPPAGKGHPSGPFGAESVHSSASGEPPAGSARDQGKSAHNGDRILANKVVARAPVPSFDSEEDSGSDEDEDGVEGEEEDGDDDEEEEEEGDDLGYLSRMSRLRVDELPSERLVVTADVAATQGIRGRSNVIHSNMEDGSSVGSGNSASRNHSHKRRGNGQGSESGQKSYRSKSPSVKVQTTSDEVTEQNVTAAIALRNARRRFHQSVQQQADAARTWSRRLGIALVEGIDWEPPCASGGQASPVVNKVVTEAVNAAKKQQLTRKTGSQSEIPSGANSPPIQTLKSCLKTSFSRRGHPTQKRVRFDLEALPAATVSATASVTASGSSVITGPGVSLSSDARAASHHVDVKRTEERRGDDGPTGQKDSRATRPGPSSSGAPPPSHPSTSTSFGKSNTNSVKKEETVNSSSAAEATAVRELVKNVAYRGIQVAPQVTDPPSRLVIQGAAQVHFNASQNRNSFQSSALRTTERLAQSKSTEADGAVTSVVGRTTDTNTMLTNVVKSEQSLPVERATVSTNVLRGFSSTAATSYSGMSSASSTLSTNSLATAQNAVALPSRPERFTVNDLRSLKPSKMPF